jgi:hypothetical protein
MSKRIVQNKDAEAQAKAALLQYLRSEGRLGADTSIGTEVTVARHSNRADLVLIGRRTTCFEIKSKSDKLMRLDSQLAAFSHVFDEVYVVAATKHMNAVMSRARPEIGLLELVEIGGKTSVRCVRPASDCKVSVDRILDLLPVSVLRRELTAAGHTRLPSSRAALIEIAERLPLARVRAALLNFLADRHSPSTKSFRSATTRKTVTARHLAHLSVWSQAPRVCAYAPARAEDIDRIVFAGLRDCFGPVPDDIRQAIAA